MHTGTQLAVMKSRCVGNIGMMERWNTGNLGLKIQKLKLSVFDHYSIFPIFHYSTAMF